MGAFVFNVQPRPKLRALEIKDILGYSLEARWAHNHIKPTLHTARLIKPGQWNQVTPWASAKGEAYVQGFHGWSKAPHWTEKKYWCADAESSDTSTDHKIQMGIFSNEYFPLQNADGSYATTCNKKLWSDSSFLTRLPISIHALYGALFPTHCHKIKPAFYWLLGKTKWDVFWGDNKAHLDF